ncbi:MAG: transposase [Microcoleus sp.]
MYSLKLELKLNNKERSLLYGCAGLAKLVYNLGLSILTQSSQYEGIKTSDSKQLAAIEKVFTNPVKTKREYAWMKGYPSAIYSSAMRNLGKAIQGGRLGKSGLAQFKSQKKGDGFTCIKKSGVYPGKGEAMMPLTNRQVRHKGKEITIPGLGNFRLKQPIPSLDSSSAKFTISRTADRWLVSFALDIDKISSRVHQVRTVGIDLGIKCFATLSDGSFIVAPQVMRTRKAKLSKDNWHNFNKRLGNITQGIIASNHALKYYQKLAKRHAEITNIIRDIWQKKTTDISRKCYQIRMEYLNMYGMIANQKLAIDLESLGLDEFRRMLTNKAVFWGTKVELVHRWFPSSQTCFCYGNIQQMPLKEPVYSCNGCGVSVNRDLNAVIILENALKTFVGEASAELRPVDKKMPSSLLEAGSKRQFKPNA